MKETEVIEENVIDVHDNMKIEMTKVRGVFL